jgi:hypothetical protein
MKIINRNRRPKWGERSLVVIAVLCLWSAIAQRAIADNFSLWHYHADTIVHPQADDSYDSVYADFTHLLKSTFHTSGILDENSIRVVPLQNGQPGAPVNYHFVKAADFDAATNAAGTLIFEVAATADSTNTQYRVYFDTKADGAKPAFQNSEDVPQAANMIWNSSFEILSANYKGKNRYANSGENMPRGWWGNLRNSGILENKATSAHSGEHAVAFVTPADKKHIALSTAPSPPAVRVEPGQNYAFSFWAKGLGLSSAHPFTASIYWYDKDGKYTARTNITTDAAGMSDFDWTKTEVYTTAPDNAYFGTMYLGTYSQTGLLTVDDVCIRIAVPALLQ